MTRVTIESPRKTLLGSRNLRLAITDARAERMEMRLAELDLRHTAEVARVEAIVASLRQRFVNARGGQ